MKKQAGSLKYTLEADQYIEIAWRVGNLLLGNDKQPANLADVQIECTGGNICALRF
jgi:hypothetical protein